MSLSPNSLEPGWREVLQNEFKQPYMAELGRFLQAEWASGTPIYPPQNLIFNALQQTPFQAVKVVIVGQDPYHGPGQAHGLCFSVPKGIRPPPSLMNIFKELHADLGLPIPPHGCLLEWAKQGVLLLNTTLTVKEGKPMSHAKKGWERLTDAIIAALKQRSEPVIFVLWGKSAQEKWLHIDLPEGTIQHSVLKAPHPSPLSAHTGFLGCLHFSKINALLTQKGFAPINWDISQA